MAFINKNSPISKDEQIIAIKSYAETYVTCQSITHVNQVVIVCIEDTHEAHYCTTMLRHAGWLSATAHKGQYTDVWFIRINLNT